jgi:hypothetical protein
VARRLRGFPAAHPGVFVALLLGGLALALVYPAVLGGKVLGPEDLLLFNAPLASLRPGGLLHPSNFLLTDAVEVFHPDLEWARGMIRAGSLPLWDPYVFGGWPVFASQQTALLYPLNWLAFVLPFWPALGIIAALKVLVAGLGSWWLCRRLGQGRTAALLAAVTYAVCSCMTIWLEHPHTDIYALIPWLLGAIDLVCARRRARDAGALAAIVGLCLLGGHPESTFIAGLAGIPFALLCLAGTGDPTARRRGFVLLAGAAVLGAAAGAVMLVPFVELAGQAPMLARGGGGGLPDASLLTPFLPDRWGRPDGGFAVTGPLNYAERTFYVGVLPLMLAVAGLYRARAGRQLFFVGLLAGALVLAVHVPVVTEAITDAPGLSYIDLSRALILASLSLAVLAGFGLERLLGTDRREQRVMLAVAGLVACVPGVWLVAHAGVLHEFPRFSDLVPNLWARSSSLAQTAAAAGTRWLVLALASLVALRLLIGGRRPRRPGAGRVAMGIAVALVAADLVTMNAGYNPAIPTAQAEPAPTPSIVSARAGQGSGRTSAFSEYLIPNVGSRYGLRDPRGHGLPALGRYLALWTRLGGKGFQATRVDPRDPRTTRLLADFGVSTVLTTPKGGVAATTGLRLAARHADGAVYRNPNALPRAFFASSWRALPTQRDALGAVAAIRPAHLLTAPVIEGVAPRVGPTAIGGGAVRFARDGGDEVALDVDAPRAGYLVLLDSYYPGWRATVDGRDATIHPADAAFRAVAVPAGRHQVVFRYLPRTLVAGAAVSGLAWIAILGLVLVPRVGRRPVSPRAPRRPRRRPPGRPRRGRGRGSSGSPGGSARPRRSPGGRPGRGGPAGGGSASGSRPGSRRRRR